MGIVYYTPDKDELLAAIRHEFAFLVTDYGFVGMAVHPEWWPNPCSVVYRRAKLEAAVEGIGYGCNTDVVFGVRDRSMAHPFKFSLAWVVKLRRPTPPAPSFGDERGQLVQLPALARDLRTFADDLLRCDFSILPGVKEEMKRAREQSRVEAMAADIERADMQSQSAFRAEDFREVVKLLVPYRDLLKSSSLKRLEIALSRLK